MNEQQNRIKMARQATQMRADRYSVEKIALELGVDTDMVVKLLTEEIYTEQVPFNMASMIHQTSLDKSVDKVLDFIRSEQRLGSDESAREYWMMLDEDHQVALIHRALP